MTEKPAAPRISPRERLLVGVWALLASVSAGIWSWSNDAMLNYGDAVAHLHIARRVIDAHEPGLSQFGSVWLPMPHLLMIPFVTVYAWWANGLAGLIPSALAYIASCIGIYRLARHWLRWQPALVGLAFFALNPNLLYLQTTAMTEPLFVCEMVWVAVWLVEWRGAVENDPIRATRLLRGVALALVAAVFTRYDGWVLAFLAWICVGIVQMRKSTIRSRAFWWLSAAVVAAPLIWLAYNKFVFGDWLDFARGPYSAAAIEARTTTGSGPPHPGWHDPWVSLLFFVKCGEMDAAPETWGNFLLITSLIGTAWGLLKSRKMAFAWALFLWLPVPFYAYSVSFGSVPIFLPVWWPHSFYNTRYGMEMLPGFALGVAFAASFLISATKEFKPQLVAYTAAVSLGVVVLCDWAVLRDRPLTYIEGTKNIASRRQFEQEIPPVLRKLVAEHPGAPVLMGTSVYPNLVAFTGIPLRQTINESDRGFFSEALADPARHAAVVVAFDGDEIDKAVKAHPQGLRLVGRFTCDHQQPGAVYVSDTPPVVRN